MAKSVKILLRELIPKTLAKIVAWVFILKSILQLFVNYVNNASNLDFTISAGGNPRVMAVWNFLNSFAGNLVFTTIGLAWLGYFVWRKSVQIDNTEQSQEKLALDTTKSEVKQESAIENPKTLKEFFKSDFGSCLLASNQVFINIRNNSTKEMIPFEITIQLMLDFEAKAEFIGFYIPETMATFEICKANVNGYKEVFKLKENVGIEGSILGEKPVSAKELQFTKRIYIYHETPLMSVQIEELEKLYKRKKLSLILRDSGYAFDRNYKTYLVCNLKII